MDAREYAATLDWRERLVYAVAYRMHAQTGIPPLAARLQVRDFVRYGQNSQHATDVMRAGTELFGPILQAFMPVIQTLATAATQVVERETANGTAAEARLLGPSVEDGPL